MKFYRLHMRTADDISAGYSWHTSKRAAEAERAKHRVPGAPDDDIEIKVVEITPTKAGIFDALRIYASHADNG